MEEVSTIGLDKTLLVCRRAGVRAGLLAVRRDHHPGGP